jgi:plasmid stabilization system protein ParE
MSLRFHPAVQHDINEVLTYYSERSPTTAERFWKALHERFGEIAENPAQFAFINEARGLRRARYSSSGPASPSPARAGKTALRPCPAAVPVPGRSCLSRGACCDPIRGRMHVQRIVPGVVGRAAASTPG